jgi:hypothetical protein
MKRPLLLFPLLLLIKFFFLRFPYLHLIRCEDGAMKRDDAVVDESD